MLAVPPRLLKNDKACVHVAESLLLEDRSGYAAVVQGNHDSFFLFDLSVLLCVLPRLSDPRSLVHYCCVVHLLRFSPQIACVVRCKC